MTFAQSKYEHSVHWQTRGINATDSVRAIYDGVIHRVSLLLQRENARIINLHLPDGFTNKTVNEDARTTDEIETKMTATRAQARKALLETEHAGRDSDMGVKITTNDILQKCAHESRRRRAQRKVGRPRDRKKKKLMSLARSKPVFERREDTPIPTVDEKDTEDLKTTSQQTATELTFTESSGITMDSEDDTVVNDDSMDVDTQETTEDRNGFSLGL